MELDSLLVPKTEAEPPESEPASLVAADSDALCTTPSSKRRRRCPGVSPTEAKDSVAEISNPECRGCGAVQDVTLSESGQVVEWGTPDNRGNWCMTCFKVWRTYYSNAHTLRLFEKWLKDAENHKNFLLAVLAFRSLELENKADLENTKINIRGHALQDRIATIRFLLQTLGLLAAPVSITLLEPGEPLPPDLDTRLLVPVVSRAGSQMGFVTATGLSLSAFANQPFARGFFNQYTALPDLPPSILQLLKPFGGASPVDVSSGSGDASAGGASPVVVSSNSSKESGQMETLRSMAKELLQGFATDAWTVLKETPVRKMMTEAATLHTTAGTTGNEAVHREAETLASGLSEVKTFIRLHREHLKIKKPFGNLAALAMPAESSQKFLQEHVGIKPSVSFALLVLRSNFAATFLATESIEKATQKLFALSVNGIMAKLPAIHGGAGVNPLLWLRVVFAEVLQGALLTACTPANVPQRARAIHEDLSAACAVWKTSFEHPVAKEFVSDLESFQIVLEATTGKDDGNHTPRVIREALARVSSQDFKALSTVLSSSSPVWKLAMTANAALIQASSQDSLGDTKFARARAILADDRLLMVVNEQTSIVASREAIIEHVNQLTDNSAIEALDESLTCVVEGFALWSRARAEENDSLVFKWAEDIVKAVVGLNEVSWLCVDGAIRAVSAQDTKLTAEQLDQFTSCLDDCVPDEDALLAFCCRLAKVVTEFPVASPESKDGLKKLVGQLQADLPSSIRLRASVNAVLRSLAAITLTPESPEQLVADWRAKNQHGSGQEALLSRILTFLLTVQTLQNSTDKADQPPNHDVMVTLVFADSEDKPRKLVSNLRTALTLATAVVDYPCVAQFRRVAVSALEVISNLFTDSLNLAGLAFGCPRKAAEDLKGKFGSFIVEGKAATLAKSAGKVLSMKIGRRWPCEAELVAKPPSVRTRVF